MPITRLTPFGFPAKPDIFSQIFSRIFSRKAAHAFALICLFAVCLPAAAFALRSPDLSGISIFPADNYWHWDISKFPVHPNSANLVASAGNDTPLHPDFGSVLDGAPFGIPYILVDKTQPKVPVNFTLYGDESDPGPYPIPLNAPIEGGNPDKGDRHVLAVDKDARMLYELYVAQPQGRLLERGMRGEIRSRLQRPARGRAGPRPTRRGCPSCRAWCVTTRSPAA